MCVYIYIYIYREREREREREMIPCHAQNMHITSAHNLQMHTHTRVSMLDYSIGFRVSINTII